MTQHQTLRSNPRAARLAALFAASVCALSLAACKIDDGSADPIAATDYHERYPIVLAKAPTTLEIFGADGSLDDQSLANLHAFANRYREFGAGRIAILAPSNQRNGATVAAIRKALYGEGLRGGVVVGYYPNYDPSTAAPVRVMFRGLVAKVAARCGLFPTDLASGDDFHEWKNVPYENYGCATQKMLAAQVDDPRDFERARAMSEPDVDMRLRAIDDVRKGQDPGTTWKVQNTTIGQVGGS